MKKAFTLIEMLISISILSIMMIFLYKSYASLNSSNSLLKDEVNSIEKQELKKKVLFLDFSLIIDNKIDVLNKGTKEDVVFIQSKNSIHNRINPYITYIVKDSILYRLESLEKFYTADLRFDNEFVYDNLGEVNSFRVYTSRDKKSSFLIDIDFKNEEDILIKSSTE